MRNLTLSEAFMRLGARTTITAECVSAWAHDGALVMTCWHDRFKRPVNGVLAYEEFFSGRSQTNRRDLRAHLEATVAEDRRIRAIIARSAVKLAVVRPSEVWFHARTDLIGKVAELNAEHFVIHFKKKAL